MTQLVDHLARLAGIDLDDTERESLTRQLQVLQQLIDALPGEHEGAGDPRTVPLDLREDEPSGSFDAATLAAIMPRREGAWFDVPPVRGDEP